MELYCDGGSRGNPGKSASAFVLFSDTGSIISQDGIFHGINTNNYAEYYSIILGLETALKYTDSITIFMDSQLVIKQLKGEFQVKSEKVKPLYERSIQLLKKFKHYQLNWIPRDKNNKADLLVNQILNRN